MSDLILAHPWWFGAAYAAFIALAVWWAFKARRLHKLARMDRRLMNQYRERYGDWPPSGMSLEVIGNWHTDPDSVNLAPAPTTPVSGRAG